MTNYDSDYTYKLRVYVLMNNSYIIIHKNLFYKITSYQSDYNDKNNYNDNFWSDLIVN